MKPSPTQLKALTRMLNTDGQIRRIPGGFWVSGSPTMNGNAPVTAINQKCDDVWCDIRTVRAMERNGWVRRLNVWPQEWKDVRELTPEGINLVYPGAL